MKTPHTIALTLARAVGEPTDDPAEAFKRVSDLIQQDAFDMTLDQFEAWWAAYACEAELEPEEVIAFANTIAHNSFEAPASRRKAFLKRNGES